MAGGNQRRTYRPTQRRRGTIYLLVLSTALLVTILGLSALTASRVQARGSEGTNDFVQARLHAFSALELGRQWIASDSNWRTTRPNGVWAANVPIGSGSFTLSGTDPDGLPLSDDSGQPLVLSAIGAQGAARYQLQVTLVPKSKGLTCLGVSLHAGSSMSVNTATLIATKQVVGAMTSVTASSSNLYCDVEAGTTITGGVYWGKRTPGVTPRTMPNTTTVFDYYLAHGTAIDIATIPTSGGVPTIQNKLISPGISPFGTGLVNPSGIYVIDCKGADLRFQRCRIVGTLVVLNVGTCRVLADVLWDPAVSNLPSLLVRGNFQDDTDRTNTLSESTASCNFNPSHTPYQGTFDTDTADTYPDIINGLVYATGNVSTTSVPEFNGVVIANTCVSIGGSVKFTYQSTFLDNPPPGFEGEKVMVVSPGTWRQLVN